MKVGTEIQHQRQVMWAKFTRKFLAHQQAVSGNSGRKSHPQCCKVACIHSLQRNRVENVDVVKWKGLHPIVVRVHVGNEPYFDIMRHEAMKQHSSENWFLEAWNCGPNHSVLFINLRWHFLNERDKRSTVRMSLSEGN